MVINGGNLIVTGPAIIVTNSSISSATNAVSTAVRTAQSANILEQPFGRITVGEFVMGIGILSLPFALILLGTIIGAFCNDDRKR